MTATCSGLKQKASHHPGRALTRRGLLVHAELRGHAVGKRPLVLELRAQPCSWEPLTRLAIRTAIGARVGHHTHLGSGCGHG